MSARPLLSSDPVALLLSVLLLLPVSFMMWARAVAARRGMRRVASSATVITGAGGTLGSALALELCTLCPLVLLDADAAALAVTQKLCLQHHANASLVVLQCDVRHAEAVRSAVAVARERLRGCSIGVLVSNAGVAIGKDLEDLTAEEVTRTFGVNTLASFYLLRELLPEWKRSPTGGCIAIVSSFMGVTGAAKLCAYSASKFALRGLVESLRVELLRDGHYDRVATVLVEPYHIRGPLFAGIFSSSMDRGRCVRSLLVRPLEPAEVARAIAKAVQRGTHCEVVVPAHLGVIARTLRCLLPLRVHDALTGFLGGCRGMDGFAGRRVPAVTLPSTAAATVVTATSVTQTGPGPGPMQRRRHSFGLQLSVGATGP